jgi:uncharacterized membrane protein (UPF0127 family)
MSRPATLCPSFRVAASLAAAGVLLLGACSGSEGGRASEARSSRTTERTAERAATAEPASDEPTAQPAEEPAAQPRVWLEPPGREPVPVVVEVARTPAQTQRGLMFRRHMAPDHGMLFQFARSRHLTFWMRNTYIPLDMVFITSDFRVLGVVENATPETDDAREVEGDSQYVLEVNAGFAREHGIVPGTHVRFEDIPPPPGADEDDGLEDEE